MKNNERLDLVVGLNHIWNSTPHNYIDANWYRNQTDTNFNKYNTSTKFIHQTGYQINISNITGLVTAQINSASGKKDIIVSRIDSMFVFKNASGSINTSFWQRFKFVCTAQSSGKFTTDAVEDIAVLSNDSVFIFKGIGTDSKLDTVPAFKMGDAVGSNMKFILAQVNSRIEPYATIDGTTNNRDEIIMRQGTTIRIFNNNNNNGISSATYIGGFLQDVDFKLADVNNDGYNDLVTCSNIQGIKIYLNSGGTIDTNVDYSRFNLFSNPRTIDVADFNKDGWNDLVAANVDSILIFINTTQSNLFTFAPSYTMYSAYYPIFPLFGKKLLTRDLYNKGGISIIFSGYTAINLEQPYNIEWLYRIDPNAADAVPAPPYLFESYVQDHSVYHPELLLFNRGDRDFLKYRIYKMNWLTYHYYLFDSTSSNQYIDTTEDLLYISTDPPDPLPDNLFYYVVAVDNSYKVSITSDTISYIGYVCPTCQGEIGPDNIIISNEENKLPKEYSVINYPNPFNPITKIFYNIPNEGNVKITVYNSIGQKIIELVNEFKQPGAYTAEFNGNNMSSGVYFYKLESGNFIQTMRMLLLK